VQKSIFLIENRQRDINNDSLAIGKDDTRGVDIWFNNNGSVIASGQFGVITRVDEYDFGIPGSGILIWHIDERVIEEKINTNRVNSDPKRRGVDLEEADGSQDIGLEVGIFGDIDVGTPLDLFYQENTAPLYKNQFTSTSVPNSLSNDRSDSHISIINISNNDTVMIH